MAKLLFMILIVNDYHPLTHNNHCDKSDEDCKSVSPNQLQKQLSMHKLLLEIFINSVPLPSKMTVKYLYRYALCVCVCVSMISLAYGNVFIHCFL